MSIRRIKLFQVLSILIFALALSVRLYQLGAAPLSDFEAETALQALQISRGDRSILGVGPGTVLFSAAMFNIFNDTNGSARVLPALAGSLLVLVPLFMHPMLGRPAALITALGMALDPGLVAASRLVGGPMVAAGFGLMAIALLYIRRPIWACIFAALTIISGTQAFAGALGLALTVIVGHLLVRRDRLTPLWEQDPLLESKKDLRNGLIAGGGVILVAATLFFQFPQGLGSLAGMVPAYLEGWLTPSGVPAIRVLTALIIYEPLPLIFGLLAAIRGWRTRITVSQWLSLWVAFAFILTLLYPGRQVIDLVWVLIPLWGLAGLEISRYFSVEEKDRLPAAIQASLILILMALAWINLAGLNQAGGDIQLYRLRLAVVGGTIALGAITTALVAMGWSATAAKLGLAWGLMAGLGLYMIATLWGVTQIRPNGEQELWYPGPAIDQDRLLLATLGDLSEGKSGFRESIDVVVTASAPSLQWALRGWPNTRFETNSLAGELPSIIINTAEQPDPSMAVAYRGQDFAWWIHPTWQNSFASVWPTWLVFRAAPQETEHVILWVRSDLFPGGVLTPQEEQPLTEEEAVPEEGQLR
jgi:hypothetical protein